MASRTTPTTLGNLEFSQIKTSLTEYLKTQTVFSGYNFEGSAMQSLIDLLAYNTFYYAYYANMINAEAFLDSAQKEDSIISLCKPLGYTVPSSTSAKALVQLSSVNAAGITAGTVFSAANSQGINYNFYNLDDIAVVDGFTEPFYIYEASRYVNFDALPTFNFNTQKIVIADENVDLSTIRVTVTETIAENAEPLEQVWTAVGNIGYTARVDENIYFIERTSTGFAILFGSSNSVGRSIDSTIEKIMVRYLKTNGEAANNLSIFRAPNLQNSFVTVNKESSSGRLAIDLDLVRFLAPKWFAAQERAVTVDDYKALLLQSGFFESEKEFNVFGGQDLTPPKYGRVFVSSTLDPTNDDQALTITQMINFLKERSVVTVFPEYVVNKTLGIYTDFTFSLGPATPNTPQNRSTVLASVKGIFRSNYTVSGEYNVSFSASDFIQTLRSNQIGFINSLIISPENFTIYVREGLQSNTEYLFNLQNELDIPTSVYIDLTEPFDSDYTTDYPGRKAVLKMFATTNGAKNNKINLKLYARNIETGEEDEINGNFGYFIANKGVIYIKSDVIRAGTTATMSVNFAKSAFRIGLNNLVSFNYDKVTLI